VPEEPVPTTITEKVRSSVRSEVRDRFEDFMQKGTAEEVRMMEKLFVDYDSNACIETAARGAQEIVLASCMDRLMSSYSHLRVKVPESMFLLVVQLVAARQKIEESEECA
jgi:hypothetical protein